MAANNLKVSQEALDSAKSGYDDCVERMTKLRNNLQNAVDGIRSGWQSEGGEAFFEKFDNQWVKNFNDYIDVIEHMKENMKTSQNKYQTVFDEANKLGIR